MSTVSLVMNGKGRISPLTRRRVQDAARALGFIPNRSAARLRSGKSTLLGLIVNDISNPYFAEMGAAFETEAFKTGYLTVLANSNDEGDRQRQLLEAMVGLGVAGIVLCPAIGSSPKDFEVLAESRVPYLTCVRDVEDPMRDFVGTDDIRAGNLAAEHLLARGHREIAFVGGAPELSPWRGRLSGIREALVKQGLSMRETLVRTGPPTRQFGETVGIELLRNNPEVTAIIAYNDLVAGGVFVAARQLGRTIGSDISVMGFGNVPESVNLAPPLSTVEGYPRAIGRRAAQLLLAAMEHETAECQRVLLTPKLIERDSVASLP